MSADEVEISGVELRAVAGRVSIKAVTARGGPPSNVCNRELDRAEALVAMCDRIDAERASEGPDGAGQPGQPGLP